MMVRSMITILAGVVMVATTARAQALDWRFGFEDTWSQLDGLLQTSQKQALLMKLQALTASQPKGGDININGTAGGWAAMQPNANAPVSFSASDRPVRLLGEYGFSMMWNLRINAAWASAANASCTDHSSVGNCAPDPAHEQALYDYVRAVVERYDGDGFQDMGYETPDDTTDDLITPVHYYLMTGEIEFAGATPEPDGGYGDSATSHFWNDNIENLLRTHRIIYRAIHDADPTGSTKLISSGGVLWDLYNDFPDYPQVLGPTVTARINGENNHGASYAASMDRLVTMLRSFGDDSDGIECDYIGWHPHMAWRDIDQTFALIRRYAPDKPIYVDDMWANIFLQQRADAPGNTQFTGGGAAIEGDFPNDLVPSYDALRNGVLFNSPPEARDWYLARSARRLVKAYATALGEGAERVCYSGIADFALDRLALTAYINLMGTAGEDFALKPSYYTCRLAVDKLHDITSARRLFSDGNPLTRVYRFDRNGRGPIYVAWSETGGAPPGLDYSIATGETVTLHLESDSLLVTRPIAAPGATEAPTSKIAAPDGVLTVRLGYEPVMVEPLTSPARVDERTDGTSRLSVRPNPLSSEGTIAFSTDEPSQVRIEIWDVVGRLVRVAYDGYVAAGRRTVLFDARDLAPGVYVCRMHAGGVSRDRPMVITGSR